MSSISWEFSTILTSLVVSSLFIFGLAKAIQDIKKTHHQQPTETDLIQDFSNAGAIETIMDGVAEKVLPTAGSNLDHLVEHMVESIAQHLHH